jgi:futalosine hydrolase
LQRMDQAERLRKHAVEICVAGVGGAQTAFHLGKILSSGKWDLSIQLGICGSFKKELPLGMTVNVVEECFADLGAEDDQTFLDVFQLELLNANKFPFENGKLLNTTAISVPIIGQLPKAKGISVNKVHGNEQSIRQVTERYDCEVESMEGAAFFYCCKMSAIPFLQVRTVSNFVEKRDKNNWDISLAVKNLNATAQKIIDALLPDETY